jgi:Na+-translocating ferredoxin:NAD+ oxidoreductase subunit G
MVTPGSDAPARHAVRSAAVLTVAAILAVGLVAVVHDRALPQIEASRRAEQLRQLTAVLGDIAYDNDPLTDLLLVHDPEYLGTTEPLPAHRVRRDGQPIAVLLNAVAPDGYTGPLRLLVAIDAQGRLLGVRVLEHRETPGLGDFVEERRTDWIRQFDGRSLDAPPPARWQVARDGGDFDQYTGATITSRAVTHAVRDALTHFARHRAELFAAPSSPVAP